MAADEWGDQGGEQQDWSMDTEGYDPGALGGGGNVVDKEGWYHWEVADVVPELDTLSNDGKVKAPKICFHMLVLHSVDGQSPAGSKLYHRINLGSVQGDAIGPPAEGSQKSAFRFGLGLGILASVERDNRQVIVDPTTGNTRIPVDLWKRAKGKQCISKVKFEKGTGNFKDKYEIPFGTVYDPRDPEVGTVQKNTEALKMAGYGAVAAGAAPATNGAAPTPAQQAAPAASAPNDDPLADL